MIARAGSALYFVTLIIPSKTMDLSSPLDQLRACCHQRSFKVQQSLPVLLMTGALLVAAGCRSAQPASSPAVFPSAATVDPVQKLLPENTPVIEMINAHLPNNNNPDSPRPGRGIRIMVRKDRWDSIQQCVDPNGIFPDIPQGATATELIIPKNSPVEWTSQYLSFCLPPKSQDNSCDYGIPAPFQNFSPEYLAAYQAILARDEFQYGLQEAMKHSSVERRKEARACAYKALALN
jgi:hypothetical protein